jgi:hypothetical protein
MDAAIDRFIDLTIHEEWPAMSQGGSSANAATALRQIERGIAEADQRTERERTVYGRALDKILLVQDLRRLRLAANQTTLPTAMWFCLYLGAAITIAFGYLFGVESAFPQLMMTTAVAAVLTLLLFLTVELDFPFRGDLKIPPDAYIALQRQFAASESPAVR